MDDGPWLIAGATGYIGGRLAQLLRREDRQVRSMARDGSSPRAELLARAGSDIAEADVLEPETLPPALEGCPVAFYLVHSMGRGGGDGYADRDRRAAENFAAAAERAGVQRIVYLGGLASGGSEHLASREQTGRILASGGVPVCWFRAAAVLGAGSESFRIAAHLASRLPVMLMPSWTRTRTQPIGIDDVIEYLAAAPLVEPAGGRQIEIGGADVTTYAGMFDAAARAVGKREPVKLPVPVLSPRLSSLWLRLVAPVDYEVAQPLVQGLTTETVVRDPSGAALFDIQPLGMEAAMRRAVAESPELG